MRIKNYTTDVPYTRTISEIEQLLTGNGADAVMKNYRGDGVCEALAFKYQQRGYKLPCEIEKCLEVLREVPEYKHKPRQWLEEQAVRVAWRNIRDWLEAQMALIRIGQAEYEQIMLPYMWDGRESMYDKLKKSQFYLSSGNKAKESNVQE